MCEVLGIGGRAELIMVHAEIILTCSIFVVRVSVCCVRGWVVCLRGIYRLAVTGNVAEVKLRRNLFRKFQ